MGSVHGASVSRAAGTVKVTVFRCVDGTSGAMARFFRHFQFRQQFAQTTQLGLARGRQANLLFASVLAEAVVQFHEAGCLELPQLSPAIAFATQLMHAPVQDDVSDRGVGRGRHQHEVRNGSQWIHLSSSFICTSCDVGNARRIGAKNNLQKSQSFSTVTKAM